MGRHRKAAFLALVTALTGVVLSTVTFVRALEDELGLAWLFQVRGAVEPPSSVVIINIEEAGRLGLPPKLPNWPRAMHGRLVDRLVESEVSAIAFDITFTSDGQSSEDNQAFADSIARAGRVVLTQLDRITYAGAHAIPRRQNPEPVLADAARGLAPAPLPKLPRVNWTLRFTDTFDADVPTLSAVLLQVHALRSLESFVGLLRSAGLRGAQTLPTRRDALRTPTELLDFMRAVRRTLREEPSARAALASIASDIGTPDGDLLRSLVALYTSDDISYLNFYGTPRKICTVAYDAVVLGVAEEIKCRLRGALVLVGGATGSARQDVDQPDTYSTVFNQPNGIELTGVEVHATAVANLLAGTSLRVPGRAVHVGLLALLGGVFAGVGYYVRTRHRLRPGAVTTRIQAATVVLGLAAAYAVGATIAFQTVYVVLPLVVPLAIQLPLALILGLVVRPAEYVEQVEAVCLATDAAGSTAVGQSVSHGRYARLMNEYNEALRAPVIARGGATLEPQGDGFICLWCVPGRTPDVAVRQQACLAALEIADASRRFNLRQPEGEQLPTRVGLNVGLVTVYSDADRGAFKAFGDVVNVAARLRDLNVELGTRVLGCDRVIDGLDDTISVRHLSGGFALKGVSKATRVFEIRLAGTASDAP